MRNAATLLALAVVAASCSHSAALLPTQSGRVEVACCRNQQPVELQYLGSGGWVMRHGRDVILTAPFFSNPNPVRVACCRISPSEQAIDAALRGVEGLDRARAVFAGHGHYDHLLDLPRVLSRFPQMAFYGGRTAVNELNGRGTVLTAGAAVRVGNVSVLPIASEHAPHFGGIKFFGGHVMQPETPPADARHWREGETFAFLIDFLNDDGSVDFRLYYDDAAHNSPYGYPDPSLTPVDAAILCVASWDEVADYPDALLAALRPRYVLLGHWEDFFTPYDQPERTVRLTDVRAFLPHVSGFAYALPRRKTTVTFTGESRK